MKNKLDQPISISITPGTIVKAIGVLLLLYLLFIIKDLLLIMLTSIVIASAIEPAARFFARGKIPRIVSVLIVYLGIALLLTGFFAIFLPPLVGDIQNLSNTIPQYIETFTTEKFGEIPGLDAITALISSEDFTNGIISKVGSTFSGATLGFFTTVSAIFGGIFSFVLIIVISFYLAVQENGVENFIRIVTPVQHEKYVIDLWKRSQRKIGLWAQGQVLLAVIVALMTYLGLSVLGVSNPMVLAVIAGLFELIPVFGPILAAIPAVGFALIDGGLTLGVITLGLYLIIQQFESQLIHPLVVKKIVGIPAIIAILALIIGAQVAGFLGIIISVPIAAAVMEYFGDLEKKKKKQMEELEKEG